TRKLDLDSMANSIIATGIVVYAARELGLSPSLGDIALYAALIVCGVVIHYSILVLSVSMVFWLTSAQGVEGTYFATTEFSRIPREAFKGVISNFLFVWFLPVVVVSFVPAKALLGGITPLLLLWVVALAIGWFAIAVFVFNRGLRRYASASS
ncbi:MAG TPA: ABC-2 family transporter protein, partial [Opitutaceae bacterium]